MEPNSFLSFHNKRTRTAIAIATGETISKSPSRHSANPTAQQNRVAGPPNPADRGSAEIGAGFIKAIRIARHMPEARTYGSINAQNAPKPI